MFSTGQYFQLIIALFLGVVLFLVSYLSKPKPAIFFLLLMLPFQIINSRFGTLNLVLVYLVGVAWLLRGQLRSFPLLGSVLAIFFVYLISMSQALKATYFDHILYIVTVGGSYLFFYLSYNYFREYRDFKQGILMFLWLNILVLAYCTIQLVAGDQAVAFLGVQEFKLQGNLIEKQRLIGPFGSAGTNGEFFALNILISGFLLMNYREFGRLWMIVPVALGNLAFLIATGSRGSFLALVIGILMFMFMFRRQLGVAGSIRLMVVGTVGMVAMGVAVVKYTDFNVLFERLGETTFEGGVPDTRQKAFELALEKIPDNLVIGHGPRLRLIDEWKRVIKDYETIPYPHNLILFLLYTVGGLGLIVYAIFFFRLGFTWWRRKRRLRRKSTMQEGLPTLAFLLLAVFLIDQLKIEFLRFQLADMQQYMFALWGMLLALTEPQKQTAPTEAAAPQRRYPLVGANLKGGAVARGQVQQ
ncbi:MAG: O-antigen ligase family protein [Pseudomonadota bacterium]